MLDKSSLRQSLGMPLHDLFDIGACYGHDHSETVVADAEAANHGVSTAPRIEHPRASMQRSPSSQLQFLLQEPLDEAVTYYEISNDLKST